jgi:hypothetical protein
LFVDVVMHVTGVTGDVMAVMVIICDR